MQDNRRQTATREYSMADASDLLLAHVVQQYIESGDFNGLPAHLAATMLGVSEEQITRLAISLVAGGKASALFGDLHPNPHIRAFADEPADKQIEKLARVGGQSFVLYPTSEALAGKVDRTRYDGRPYTLALALGKPQLEYASIDFIVLD